MGKDIFHWSRLCKAPSSLVLDIFRDGDTTASMGNLCQGLSPFCAYLAGSPSPPGKQELQLLKCDCVFEDQLQSTCPAPGHDTHPRIFQRGVCNTGIVSPYHEHYLCWSGCYRPSVHPEPYLCFVSKRTASVLFAGCPKTCCHQLWLPGSHVCFPKASENTEA